MGYEQEGDGLGGVCPKQSVGERIRRGDFGMFKVTSLFSLPPNTMLMVV